MLEVQQDLVVFVLLAQASQPTFPSSSFPGAVLPGEKPLEGAVWNSWPRCFHFYHCFGDISLGSDPWVVMKMGLKVVRTPRFETFHI